MRMPVISTRSCLAATAALSIAAAAPADVISSDVANSIEGLGEFLGTASYFANAPNDGILTITLTNTSDPTNGGFITGFVFNIDTPDASAMATLSSATHPFVGLTSHAAPPFGMSYTAGAALGGNWSGGGKPKRGIGVGETGTFVFDVSAADAAMLGAQSFASGSYDFNFVVRFRGFESGGSDKVPGVMATIPGPAALCVLVLGALTPRRRRRVGM